VRCDVRSVDRHVTGRDDPLGCAAVNSLLDELAFRQAREDVNQPVAADLRLDLTVRPAEPADGKLVDGSTEQ